MNNREDQSAHLTFEQLADYQEGRLSQEDMDLVEAHLDAECIRCHDDLAWLRETQATMRSDDWVQPPDEIRAIARRSYRDHYRPPVRKSTLPAWLEVVLAPRPQLVMAGAAALILLVVVGVVVLALIGQEPSLTATVAEVTGLVEMQSAGSDQWKPVAVGTELKASDSLRSGADAGAALQFPDASETELDSNSLLSILQLRTPRSGVGQIVALRQNLGHTSNNVQSQDSADSRFEIETPSAIVAVRGTTFDVAVTESGATLVRVSEGFVEVTGDGEGTVVQAGEIASVLPGASAALGVPLPSAAPTSTPVLVQATEPSAGDASTEIASATATPEPTPTPTPTVVVFYSATPTPAPPQATSPPAQPTSPPPPQDTATPEPVETKKTPPGLTRTPQPPGQTRNPGSNG
jgi:hypothetical protein